MIGNAKRFTAVVLCLLLCLGMTPVSALAAEDAEALVLTEEELSERPELREEEPTVDLNEEETVPEEPAVGQAEEAVPEEPAAGQAEEAVPEEPAVGQAEEAAPEERLPEETILVIESDPVIYIPGGDDNTRALDGFARSRLDSLLPAGAELQRVKNLGGDFTGIMAAVYTYIRAEARKVADGERTSTVFAMTRNQLGLSKTEWTAQELGTEIVVNNRISDAAIQAALEYLHYDLSLLTDVLLADGPYDFYWFNKNAGVKQSPMFKAASSDGGVTWKLQIELNITYSFAVAEEFAAETYATTGEVGAAVTAAVARAAQIVADNAELSDDEKLAAYKTEICVLTDYNAAAAAGGVAYGNPWQLIWVFDGDDATKVVCEGYAKAFQYLCDLSSFSGDVTAYSVTGEMDGEDHMWNVVSMPNGKNYLVDVTNCDSGSIGYPDKLFLAGGIGSPDTGYTVCGISYQYDSDALSTFSKQDRTISGNYYTEEPAELNGTFTNEAGIRAHVDAGWTDIIYAGSEEMTVERSVMIPQGMTVRMNDKALKIAADGSLTVEGTLIYGSITVDGTMTVAGTGDVHPRFELTVDHRPAVSGAVTVNGSLSLLGYLENYGLTGEDRIVFGDSGFLDNSRFPVDSNALGYALMAAAAETDPKTHHQIFISDDMTMTGDCLLNRDTLFTVVGSEDFRPTLTIPAGITVMISDSARLRTSRGLGGEIRLEGSLFNDATVWIEKGRMTLAGGSYAGTGRIQVTCADNSFWETMLPGFEWSLFRATQSGSRWTLTLVPAATVMGVSLSLKGQIGIYVYAQMPDIAKTAKLTYLKTGAVKTFALDKNSSYYLNSSNTYKLLYENIPAKEMTQPLVLEVFDANGVALPLVHSKLGPQGLQYSCKVVDYCSIALSNPETDPKLVNLVKAILNYGQCAQLQFKFETEHLANPENYMSEEMKTVTPAAENAAEIPENAWEDVGYYGGSLTLKGAVNANIYFTKEITATDGGDKTYTVRTKDEKWYVTVDNIPAKNLGDKFTVVASYGDKSATIRYSALSYTNTVLDNESSEETLKNMAKALILYNYYAREWFGN